MEVRNLIEEGKGLAEGTTYPFHQESPKRERKSGRVEVLRVKGGGSFPDQSGPEHGGGALPEKLLIFKRLMGPYRTSGGVCGLGGWHR